HVPSSNPEASERFVTEEQYELVYQSLKKLLASDDTCFVIKKKEIAAKASLAELLTDIYQDIKDFVLLYQKPSFSAKENAINECISLFEKNWGPKLLATLQALHLIIYPASSKVFDHDDLG
ncbi:MAG: DUF5063 domain-containing protein, partial [Bacteroidota bacterium]|nr:DUF5063 domain-containing protein [Bacteroidota bacterium]